MILRILTTAVTANLHVFVPGFLKDLLKKVNEMLKLHAYGIHKSAKQNNP